MRIAAFLVRRLAYGLLLLLGVSILTFLLAELAPGNYIEQLRMSPHISEAARETLRERLGLNSSPLDRYIYWLDSLRRLELGFSYESGQPVAPLVGRAARNTLWLSGAATLLSWALAIPLGVWTASRKRTWRTVIGGASSLLLSVPDVLIALLLLLVAVRTGWFPSGGMTSVDFRDLSLLGRIGDLAQHALLPVTALVLTTLPSLFRHVEASVAEVLASPYMRALRGTGIPRRRRLFRYALTAAANPIVSLLGLSIATLLGTSLIVEMVMDWPGIGPLLLRAVFQQDVYVVMGVIMASTALLLLGNLVADVALFAVDPRTREEV